MDKLIQRYCKGDYSKEDLIRIKKFLESNEVDEEFIKTLKLQWDLCDGSEIGDKERFAGILQEIRKALAEGGATRTAPVKKKFSIGFISKVAAVLLIPVLVAVFVLQQKRNDHLSAQDLHTISTSRGSLKTVVLPDGSKVWLNAESSLSYAESDFNDKQRLVHLKGQGYFEVTKNPLKPFVVQGKSLLVKVLGTKFNFSTYDEDPKVSVTLLEGSVALAPSNKQSQLLCRLVPDQKAVFDKSQGKLVVEEVNASNAKEWTSGALVFEDEELIQIARELERHFDIKVQFENESIKHLKFFGRFKTGQSLDAVLGIMVSEQRFDYERKGNLIVFRYRQAQNDVP